MLNAMRSCASPGRGGHRAAMRASELVYRCREQAAELFDVPDPARVVFTMNATHGLNIAIRSLARAGTTDRYSRAAKTVLLISPCDTSGLAPS